MGDQLSDHDDLFKKKTPRNDKNPHHEAEVHLDITDFKAMCIAMAQVFLPIALWFAGGYILVIMFINLVWLR